MTSSTRRQSEAPVSTTPIDYRNKWANLLNEKNPKLDVEKKSIERLKSYSKQRYLEALKERDPQYRICMMHFWDGAISAITEILEMEDQ